MAYIPLRSAARERQHLAAVGGDERYTVIERLGAGGMGVVYRVFDRVTGEERALKRAIVEGQTRSSTAAFEREYQTLASLDHPRIILGSAWQVETWQCTAMMLLYTHTLDSVEATRLVHRLETLSRSLPALRRYQRLAQHKLMIVLSAARYVEKLAPEWLALPPRSYIGWASTLAFIARGFNEIGQHDQARRICEDALAQLTDAHRDYVALFSPLDLQLALADAGLSQYGPALARLDRLLKRFSKCDHPLLQGSIHDARARVCWAAGDLVGYKRSLELVEIYFTFTGTPALIAKCEQLSQLARGRTRPSAGVAASAFRTPSVMVEAATNDVSEDIQSSQTSVSATRKH